VVITATRTETPASKTAASVTVIDQNDIETRQYGLLADALRLVPGLAIVNNGSPGTVAGVFLRGTKTANTMVLIDGRPVPFNLAGSFNVETTPLDNVERIEVLRGPASSLYGGRTIGGVINVLTRDGRDLEKPETTAFFEAGSYGSIREGISHLGSADRLDWGLEFTRTDFEGQRLNSRFENTSAAGKVGWQATDTIRLDLDLRYYNADVGVPGPIAGLGANDPDNHLLTEFWSLSPRLIWDTTENWRQTLTFSTSNFRQVATNFAPGFGLNNRITVRTQFLEYLSVVDITERWSVTAGTSLWDVVYSRYNDDAPGLFNPGGLSYDVDQSETNWAIFAQTQVKITDRLQWLAGVRRDEYSDFGSDITWRTGASWRIPVTETLLHANYGTAFAPPTPQDREPALFGLPTLLKPERSRGVEVGLTQPLFEERVSASITWFRNDIRNYIEFDPVLFAMQQIDRARTQGLECQLDFRSCDRVEFGLGYTYLDADNRSDNRRLVRRPRHTVTAQASVRPVDALTLGFTANWVIDREDGFGVGQSDQEDFFNVRLFGSWQLTENISLFGRVENLLGDDYQEARGFPALDTGAYAGVKVKF
jgi:vitamin B12 transporter